MPFFFAERRPAAELTPWFASYWEFAVRDGAPPLHYVPPDGCTSILIGVAGPARGAALITGPWLEPLAVPVRPGTRYFGIRLRPGAAATVLGVQPASLVNRNTPARPVIGSLETLLIDTLSDAGNLDAAAQRLDRILLLEIPRLTAPDPLVSAAVESLMASLGERPIAMLANDLNTSQRTLLRHFRAATGLTPKQFAKIRRLIAAAWRVVDGGTSWSQIAAASGYADQPHLHHDFVSLTGLKPEAFGERVRTTEHDRVCR